MRNKQSAEGVSAKLEWGRGGGGKGSCVLKMRKKTEDNKARIRDRENDGAEKRNA